MEFIKDTLAYISKYRFTSGLLVGAGLSNEFSVDFLAGAGNTIIGLVSSLL